MNLNIRPSDRATLLAALDPVSQSADTVTTGWISAAEFFGFLAKLSVGAMTTNSTVDAKLEQAQDDQGTGAKDIAGKAITQLTEAGGDGNQQVLINLRQSELDGDGGFTHFQLSVTVATAASLIYAEVLGLDARYQPETHAATVAEVVT